VSVARIRQKLFEAKKREKSEKNWNDISYDLRPPLLETEVAAVEERIGVTLPEGYRSFLTSVGDGGVGPGYGLYGLEASLEQRREGIYGLDDEFVPPASSRESRELRAPGMLYLAHEGCAYYTGLVVSGPERGSVWSYIEVAPGWVPILTRCLDEEGDAYRFDRNEDDYARWYDVMLGPQNRPHRTSFLAWYEAWVDDRIS